MKTYSGLISRKIFPNFVGSVHTLTCPILSKELETELLCGADPKYSTGQVVLYSGYLQDTFVPKFSISCIDLLLKNDKLLNNVDTDIIWHGKCFISFPTATEIFLNHEVTIEYTNTSSTYKLESGGVEYYSIELPPITDSRYTSVALPDDKLLTTAHSHIFTSFFKSPIPNYCPVPEERTISLMNINFSKMLDKSYIIKATATDMKFNPEISTLFGLANRFDETTLDTTKCSAAFLKGFYYIYLIIIFKLEIS